MLLTLDGKRNASAPPRFGRSIVAASFQLAEARRQVGNCRHGAAPSSGGGVSTSILSKPSPVMSTAWSALRGDFRGCGRGAGLTPVLLGEVRPCPPHLL